MNAVFKVQKHCPRCSAPSADADWRAPEIAAVAALRPGALTK